jgi:hypothetical protein
LIPKQAPTPGNFAVLDYYDGNTVTALWNYAQRFAATTSKAPGVEGQKPVL